MPSLVISANFEQANQGNIEVRDPSGNLIVPVIKNANMMNLVGLTKAVNDLVAKKLAD